MAAAATLAIVLLAGGCASTSLTNQWRNTEFTGPPLKKLLVVGVSKDNAVRRIFEDEFAANLRAAGVEAIPSYTQLPQSGQVDEVTLQNAVAAVGADGVLVTRLVKVQQQTQVMPAVYGPPGVGFYGWYSSAWVGYYEPPSVYQYDVVTAETSVYGLRKDELIWSGTTETFAPTDVKKETKEFAQIIIAALKKAGVI